MSPPNASTAMALPRPGKTSYLRLITHPSAYALAWIYPRNLETKKTAKMVGFFAGSRAPRKLILAPVELTGLKV